VILPALAHSVTALWLALYGLNIAVLVCLYFRHRMEVTLTPDVARCDLPSVVVQVPVYNEIHVVERVIDSLAALDYPADRLHIQILDDSSDATTGLACTRARLHRCRGVDIDVIRRADRADFKAGALSWGLAHTEAELVAMFDADFRPRSDFLLQTVPHFLARPRLGMVQSRWTYLNADYSPITRAQAIGLDGHFVVEQIGRSRSGLPFNFNGSGGVWRRRCIEECGGWSADTLTEDLDLSYRAQLAGWKCLYLPTVEAPAELPPQLAAFKRQQARWAQGSVQTLRKLAPQVLRSRSLTLGQKVMALLHLSSYIGHALMVPLLLLSLPVILLPNPFRGVLDFLGLTCAAPLLVYAISQRHLYHDWLRRLRAFPLLALLGLGVAWEIVRAVWRGLTGWGGSFARTPKFRLEGTDGVWKDSGYRLDSDGGLLGELALAAYALATAGVALHCGCWGMAPVLLMYAASFGTVVALQLGQSLAARRAGSPRHASPVHKAADRRHSDHSA
jgi:cellulose synthase/poly-beta-1,6-N-acetylglucosamine synthase-like glycosyltransferase